MVGNRHLQMRPSETPKTMVMIVQRQLEDIWCGNGSYLEIFLLAAKRAGLEIRIVFAPWRSFGNRPWSKTHARFRALANEMIWPRSVVIYGYNWSLSATVWWKFVVRLVKEIARRAGVKVPVYSYLGEPLSEKETRIVADICSGMKGRITVAEYSSLGPVLKALNSDGLKGVLMHDLFADRGRRFRQIGRTPDFLEISRELEAEWVSGADFCIFASVNELAEFKPFASHATTLWLPPRLPIYPVAQKSGNPRVVFLGTLHAGNEDALHHLVDDIWPHIVESRPDTELWVVGSIERCLSNAQKERPGLKILGRWDDLAEIGGMNSIGVAPTRLATGISIKVAEYLALGMPCVVYPLALEGFGSVLDELVDVATSSQDFASRILRLLDDAALRERRSAGFGAEARAHLSDSAVVEYLRAVDRSPLRVGAPPVG